MPSIMAPSEIIVNLDGLKVGSRPGAGMLQEIVRGAARENA